MAYLPPFARMRTIRANKLPDVVQEPAPANVEEALEETEPEAPEPVVEVAEVPEPLLVDEPEAAEDSVTEPEISATEEVSEDAVDEAASADTDEAAESDESSDQPPYSKLMKKVELLEIANKHGVQVDENMTKAEIVDALMAAGV